MPGRLVTDLMNVSRKYYLSALSSLKDCWKINSVRTVSRVRWIITYYCLCHSSLVFQIMICFPWHGSNTWVRSRWKRQLHEKVLSIWDSSLKVMKSLSFLLSSSLWHENKIKKISKSTYEWDKVRSFQHSMLNIQRSTTATAANQLRIPVFRPYTRMNNKQRSRIILLFDRSQFIIMRTEKRFLEIEFITRSLK